MGGQGRDIDIYSHLQSDSIVGAPLDTSHYFKSVQWTLERKEQSKADVDQHPVDMANRRKLSEVLCGGI